MISIRYGHLCHGLRAMPSPIYCSKGFDPNPKPMKKPQEGKKTGPVERLDIEQGQQISPTPQQREVPSYIANRVLGRIAIFSGVPVFIGLCLLPFFYYLKAVKQIDIPTSIVYLSQVITFGGGLLGISYAILSSNASGNEEDFIGFDTFTSNLKNIIGRK